LSQPLGKREGSLEYIRKVYEVCDRKHVDSIPVFQFLIGQRSSDTVHHWVIKQPIYTKGYVIISNDM